MSKEYAKQFYQCRTWQDTAKAVRINKQYTCEICKGYGYIVHHIKHITPANINDSDITLNINNLMLLCNECHNKIHSEHFPTVNGVIFTADGDIAPANADAPPVIAHFTEGIQTKW